MNKHPTVLIVDLDHTLIETDLLYESSKGVLKKSPWLILHYLFWFVRGKGYLKNQLVQRFDIDPKKLPYNQTALDYIKLRKSKGSVVILATASHKIYAQSVVEFLQADGVKVFDDVMASDATFNLSSHNKAKKLIERFGRQGFDYMGDHLRDLPVWRGSNLSILVNVNQKIIKKTVKLKRLILSQK
jgi:phosphoserine phosphatase